MNTYKISVSPFQLKEKLIDGDPRWEKFNTTFENKDIETDALIDKIYLGQSITTWHRNRRRTENYICGQHLGLDFDSGDYRSSLDYLKQDKFISKYASFLYTTPRHKPEAPRGRVIFLLDTPIMQAKNYSLAAQSFVWLFDVADAKCKDAVRFFYGSYGCEMVILANRLPLDVVKDAIKKYQSTGQANKKKVENKDYHAPASQQEVSEILKLIPPWQIDYDEWVQVLMGIHSEFGEAGYSLAENWADGKPGEVDQKWRSFKADGNPSGAVTIATVFGIAKKFGWKKYVDK